jgi:hypothetical protein
LSGTPREPTGLALASASLQAFSAAEPIHIPVNSFMIQRPQSMPSFMTGIHKAMRSAPLFSHGFAITISDLRRL